MISENSTPKTQARAFSLFAFTGNLGIFIAPLIGGIFSEPAKHYPKVFGNIQFFKEFPYALPSFIVSVIAISAAILSILFLKEVSRARHIQFRANLVSDFEEEDCWRCSSSSSYVDLGSPQIPRCFFVFVDLRPHYVYRFRICIRFVNILIKFRLRLMRIFQLPHYFCSPTWDSEDWVSLQSKFLYSWEVPVFCKPSLSSSSFHQCTRDLALRLS